jgi:hypothetical protein
MSNRQQRELLRGMFNATSTPFRCRMLNAEVLLTDSLNSVQHVQFISVFISIYYIVSVGPHEETLRGS